MTDPDALTSPDLAVALPALRDLLAERLRSAEPKDTAPLARQLSLVLAQIDALPGQEKSDIDELAAARNKRRASVSKRAGSANKRGTRSGGTRKASGPRARPVAGGDA